MCRNRSKMILVFMMVLSPIFSGCWEQKIFEQNGFILNLAIESADNDKMLVTVTYPFISTVESNVVEVIQATAGSVREARTKMRQESSKLLTVGKIQQVMFSEEFAKKGIHGCLEIFERDPENSLLPWVVVVEGSPNKLLHSANEFLSRPRPAEYINKLLEIAERETYTPETRVYRFDIEYFTQGLDPVTPMIKLISNGIRVVGCALFKDDCMVGKLNTQEYSLLALINNQRSEKTRLILPQKLEKDSERGNRSIAINVTKSRSKINSGFKNSTDQIEQRIPKVDIQLDLTTDIEDYQWDSLNTPEKQKLLEKYIQEYTKKEIKRIIQYIQSTGSDPLGIGNRYHALHNAYFNAVDWDETYPKVEFDVQVNAKIDSFGIID